MTFIVFGAMVFVYIIVENYEEMHCVCRDNFLLASVYHVKCGAFLFVFLLQCLELQ